MPSTELLKLKDTKHIYEGPAPHILWQRQLTAPADSSLLMLDGKTEETAPVMVALPRLEQAKWMRVSMAVTGTQKEWRLWNMPEMIARFYGGGQVIGEEGIRPHRFLGEEDHRRLHVDVLLEGRQPDSVGVFLRAHQCPHPLTADSLQVSLF